MMKLYVAGPSLQWHQCARTIHQLARDGWAITYNWTWHFDGGLLTCSPRAIAERDLRAVDEADALVLMVFPGVESSGASTELGWALAKGKPVVCWVMGDPDWKSRMTWDSEVRWIEGKIFLAHPLCSTVYSYPQLLRALEKLRPAEAA